MIKLVPKYRGGSKALTPEQKEKRLEQQAERYWEKGKRLYNELLDAGITDKISLAGILGNIALESGGFDPYASNNINGGHWGYLQNDKHLHGYMSQHFGKDHNGQIKYIIAGLQGKLPKVGIGKAIQARFNGYLDDLQRLNVTDPEHAAFLWERNYERSNNEAIPQRKYFAKYFYDRMMEDEAPTVIEAIQPIQRIEIPDALRVVKPKVHQVVKGNTLGQIAKQYNTTVDDLARINNIADIDRIEVGDNLRVDEDTPRLGREDIAYGWYNMSPTISNPSIDFEDPMLAYQNADYLNYLRNNYI